MDCVLCNAPGIGNGCIVSTIRSNASKQSTHLGVLCLLHEKMWDSKGTGLRAKKRPVDAYLVPRAGVGTGAVPTGVPLPAPR